ncbi:hypothetical protein [Lacrimispora sp.]|uniref:hypothetical protein n=1 Tax=Lacrimispora sp. TaxID=2719234 RepID=UPI00285717F9|nr:hypothetical protein [Lacrimispora sp.]MDR7811296.1 hypothetical protein [Lacrimispora sp.]
MVAEIIVDADVNVNANANALILAPKKEEDAIVRVSVMDAIVHHVAKKKKKDAKISGIAS